MKTSQRALGIRGFVFSHCKPFATLTFLWYGPLSITNAGLTINIFTFASCSIYGENGVLPFLDKIITDATEFILSFFSTL